MAEDLDVRIGRNLHEIRSKAGLDIDALARRAGLRPGTIADYEAGSSHVPVDVLARLAEELSVLVSDFFS